ncbi:Hypothetical protein, putative zinc metallopeptidase [Metamycoplasma auris 15026]|uniref:YgjP-like metallopeptidase domain-containing protein n=1 Tax=Metamycoplasma auris 15026 TaxID=1188233 RepID=N9VB36_9BACT|nr:M48 family metallopeptidase [Metamycoplasma auris]ENY68611.1 Hypothetical protein, putative zinc metallopeptidase [Metamycoplasma auris 15026]
MKKPDWIMQKQIKNTMYEIKFFYTNAKHVYLTYEDGFFVVRGNIVNLSKPKFETFLDEAIFKILEKLKSTKKNVLDIDATTQQFYYFGKLCKYEVANNLIVIKDLNNKIIKEIKFKNKNKNLDAKEIIKKELKKELLIKFDFLAQEASKAIFKKKIDFEYAIYQKKTSWASIVIQKNKINLSADLIYFDMEIIRYVAYHEISHIVHQNHSAKFWALVAKFIPNYKILKNKLKNHIFN